MYEVERDGELLKHEWIELKNEQRVFEVPVTEADRGNLSIHVTFIKDNRLYKQSETISVPFSNKNLSLAFESFRDKLQPGQQEQWKIKIKGNGAEKVAAEMVATLYDESLDQFRSNSWYANFFNSHYARLGWSSTNGFNRKDLSLFSKNWNPNMIVHHKVLTSIVSIGLGIVFTNSIIETEFMVIVLVAVMK